MRSMRVLVSSLLLVGVAGSALGLILLWPHLGGFSPAGLTTPSGLTGEALQWQSLRVKPLRLPSVGSGQSCPVTASHSIGVPQAQANVLVQGVPPLYMETPTFVQPGPTGLYSAFYAAGPYSGPVLIRGRQLNSGRVLGFTPASELQPTPAGAMLPRTPQAPAAGARLLRSAWVTGSWVRLYEELDINLPAAPAPGGVSRIWTAYADVDRAGCYGYQVDGLGFSEVVVFQPIDPLTPAPQPAPAS
jgi:hypothetical protein